MTDINKATSQPTAPTPVQTHEGETSGASPKLASLSKRDSSAEFATDTRLQKQGVQKQGVLSRIFADPSLASQLGQLTPRNILSSLVWSRFTPPSERETGGVTDSAAKTMSGQVLQRTRPSLTFEASLETARVAGNEETPPQKSIGDRKNGARAAQNPRSRFSGLKAIYDFFKNLFKKLLPRNWKTKTATAPATAPAPVAVTKAMVKEKYERAYAFTSARVTVLGYSMDDIKDKQPAQLIGFRSGLRDDVRSIGMSWHFVNRAYERIANQGGEEISKTDQDKFNSCIGQHSFFIRKNLKECQLPQEQRLYSIPLTDHP